MTEFQFEIQTLRERGPRVSIKIPGLREYLQFFNRPKIYSDDSRAILPPSNRFNYGIESAPPKTTRERLKAVWGYLNGISFHR